MAERREKKKASPKPGRESGEERIVLRPTGRYIPREERRRKLEELRAGEFAAGGRERGEQSSDAGIAIKCPHCGKELIIDVWKLPPQVSRIITYRSRNDYDEHRRLIPRL